MYYPKGGGTYTHGYTPDIELHVNDDFWRIYKSTTAKGISIHVWWIETGLHSIMIR